MKFRKFSNEWINEWIERCFIVLINFNGQLNSLMKEREKKVIFQYERVTKWKARQSVKEWYKYHYHGVKRNILMAFLCLRYAELNTKLQVSFRRYNSAIPSYLRERLHHIIKHSYLLQSLSQVAMSQLLTWRMASFWWKAKVDSKRRRCTKSCLGPSSQAVSALIGRGNGCHANIFLPYSSTSRHGRLIDFQKNIEIPHSSVSIEMCS